MVVKATRYGFKKLAKRAILSIFFIPVVLVAFILIQRPERIDEQDVVLDIEGNWTYVCISSQYEIPDITINKITGQKCWGGHEVPLRTIFLSYTIRDSKCLRYVLDGHFLEEGVSETRCFSRGEADDLKLTKKGNVYVIAFGGFPNGGDYQ